LLPGNGAGLFRAGDFAEDIPSRNDALDKSLSIRWRAAPFFLAENAKKL
jgi:hypothetical protein